jgi:serine protease AprX
MEEAMARHKSWFAAGVLAAVVGITACQDAPEPPTAPASGEIQASATMDPNLSAAIAGLGSADQVEVIVTFNNLLTTGDVVQRAVLDLGAGAIGFVHLPMVAALATPAQVTALQAVPGVTGVYLSGFEQPLNVEAVTSVKADQVYTMQAGGLPVNGKGIGIAILDTGVDATHPDLALGSKVVQNVHTAGNSKDFYEFGGRDSITGLKTPKELKKGAKLWIENVPNTDISASGHGTHVASTTAGSGAASGGKYHGIAPGAHIVGVNASAPGGFPALLILAGWDYILEHRKDYNIQVVNNSWGSAGAYDPNEPIPQAAKVLHDAGITVVFAAGNDGPDQNTMNRRSVAPWVISVAASCKLGGDPVWVNGYCRDDVVVDAGVVRPRFLADDGRDGILTSFSSRGIPGDPVQHPDILAPGARIVSARAKQGADMVAHEASFRNVGSCPQIAEEAYYACVSGTSMAAPVTSGIVALLEQATGGRITPDQTLEVLMSTATSMPKYYFWEVGAGHVNARAAVEAAMRLYR